MRARPPHAPAQGPMLASARRRALKATAVYGVLPVFSHNVGRAISPALQHKAHGPQNREQRAAAPPAKRGARPCRTLRDISAANRQCTPQSAPSGASSSPCRGAFLGGRRPKSLPCKGRCRRRRRRGAAPCPANILPGCCALPATIHPAKHGERPFPATALSRLPPAPCVGADACIGPSSGVEAGCRLRVAAPFRPQCRAGDLARRGALWHHRALRGKHLPGFKGYFRRQPAMHPSVCAFRRIRLPLAGEPSGLQTGGPCKLPAAPAP